MSNIVYRELRRRYEHADYQSMTTEELCQALDSSGIAVEFLKKCHCEDKSEFMFWNNVAARSVRILKQRNVQIYFVSSLEELADVLFDVCQIPESAEYIRRSQLSELSMEKLNRLIDIILDSNHSEMGQVLKIINRELDERK